MKSNGRDLKSTPKRYLPVLEGPGASLERTLTLTVRLDFYGTTRHGVQIREQVEKLLRLHYGTTTQVTTNYGTTTQVTTNIDKGETK